MCMPMFFKYTYIVVCIKKSICKTKIDEQMFLKT